MSAAPLLAPPTDTKSSTSPPPAGTTPCCPKCGSTEPWGLASWCPNCSYYPALGSCVVEQNADAAATEAAPKSLWELVPAWAWTIVAGVVATVAVSVLGRILTPEDSWARTWWTVAQFAIGAVIFLVGHVWAYYFAIMKSDRFSAFDFFINPFGIWSLSCRQLPNSSLRVQLASWGMSAALCALLVVGGIRYSAIFDDWGVRHRAQVNLVHEITKIAKEQNAKEEGSLEDAVKNFAEGDAALPTVQYESIDCVVFGYTKREGEQTFDSLLLASLVNQKLQYVGMVSLGVPDEVRQELDRRMKTLEQARPLVHCPQAGTWVKPILACRIQHVGWSAGRINQPQFEAMLRDVQ